MNKSYNEHGDSALLKRLRELEAVELQSGKPQVGWIDRRTPIELIEAAGAMPIRLFPSNIHNEKLPGAVRSDACSFCSTLASAFDVNHFPHLSAILTGSTCDQMRRMCEEVARTTTIPMRLISLPRTYRRSIDSYFLNQIDSTWHWIAEVLGVPVSEDSLAEAVETRNRLRVWVSELRREGWLSTRELHALAGSVLNATGLLKLMDETIQTPEDRSGSIRLALLGAVVGAPVLDIIEQSGGVVVYDGTNQGDSLFVEPASPQDTPIRMLYNYYGMESLEPARRPVMPALYYLKKSALSYGASGVILINPTHCHPWGLSAKIIKEFIGLPFLHLEEEYGSLAISRLSTRIGAFTEMLSMKRTGNDNR